jgi:hypothetical protein
MHAIKVSASEKNVFSLVFNLMFSLVFAYTLSVCVPAKKLCLNLV